MQKAHSGICSRTPSATLCSSRILQPPKTKASTSSNVSSATTQTSLASGTMTGIIRALTIPAAKTTTTTAWTLKTWRMSSRRHTKMPRSESAFSLSSRKTFHLMRSVIRRGSSRRSRSNSVCPSRTIRCWKTLGRTLTI